MDNMEQLSETHMRECYDFYRENAPFHVGMTLRVYDENHKLYAIGKCVHVYWSKHEEWIVGVEIMEDFGLCISDFSAHQCLRHTGFLGKLA